MNEIPRPGFVWRGLFLEGYDGGFYHNAPTFSIHVSESDVGVFSALFSYLYRPEGFGRGATAGEAVDEAFKDMRRALYKSGVVSDIATLARLLKEVE